MLGFFSFRSLSKVIPERAKAPAFINLSVTNIALFCAPQPVNFSGLRTLLSPQSTILGNDNAMMILIIRHCHDGTVLVHSLTSWFVLAKLLVCPFVHLSFRLSVRLPICHSIVVHHWLRACPWLFLLVSPIIPALRT